MSGIIYCVKIRTVSGVGKLIFVINCQAKRTVTSFVVQRSHKPPRDFVAAVIVVVRDLGECQQQTSPFMDSSVVVMLKDDTLSRPYGGALGAASHEYLHSIMTCYFKSFNTVS
jgi:hypothetical protein